MNRFWIYQYLILHYATLAICESFYSIIAPGVMKSNRKYSVYVTLHDASEPSTIRVAIEGPSFNDAQEIYVQPFESKRIEFLPPKLAEGNYRLKAEGLSGFQFKNESKVNIDTYTGPKIYIQTDKAIYKPQDLVRFRVVILDEHTRPLNIKEPIRIEIHDGLDNRVKQFKNVVLVKGVYTSQFQLSQQPVLGTWEIRVFISGRFAYTRSKSIEVKKYVLPKFSVFIKTPTDIVLEDGYIKAIIYGKYTFDKYVEGNVTAELWDSQNDVLLQQKKFDIKNLGFAEFHFENLKPYENLYGVSLRVKLTEKYTGITQNDEVYIYFHKQRYDIEIPFDEIEFKNNKPYRLKAQIRYWTGAQVFDRETPVHMDHGSERYETYLDDKGVATFEFEHQSDAGHTVEYKDSKGSLPNIYTNSNLKLNETEYYCKLTLADKRLRIGKTVEIEVTSIANIPYLVYTIVGHGSLIRMEHIQVQPNQKSYTIQIKPSIEMIPHSFVYVYYVHNGNLRYEEMRLSFPNEFENQISVVAPKQVRPGQEVTIAINAQPKSYVSIMAVDLSVCLLDCSYDLSRYDIFHDLSIDRTFTPIIATTYPGLLSGLITLTNAHYPFYSLGDVSYKSPASRGPLRFRTKFPETWIFENFEINNTNTELTLNIPDTVTTWRITAFTNNDITGFGMVDGPTDITTIQPFFISLNLPYSVKRGEIVNIPITVFNYLNQSVDTEIIMYNNDQEFYFMESTIQGAEKSLDDRQQIKHLHIPSDGGKTVEFLISPKQVGEISLRVSATNSLYSDAVHQKLKVEAEGVTKFYNQAIYLKGQSKANSLSSFMVDVPMDKIPDSEYITLSVAGDIVVPTLDNLNDLVQMPTGCGEQNMVHFAPNILILQYLKANGKFSKEKELVKKIRSYTDIGYQQQLSYRHKNGGYSLFGEKTDEIASTWLTAYVVRFFLKASQFLSIETRIIESDLEFLAKQQKVNGEFMYTGYLFEPVHLSKYGYTAFLLLTFLEDRLPKPTHQVHFQLSGAGHALLQLSYQYNVVDEEEFKHFLINPKANVLNTREMNLEICFIYKSKLPSLKDATNMVIMEANLPSGYRSDAEFSFDLIENELIQKIESKNSESTIILYIDNLSENTNHCLNIAADKTNDVIERKPSAIIMYDYYNLSRSNTKFYNIQ